VKVSELSSAPEDRQYGTTVFTEVLRLLTVSANSQVANIHTAGDIVAHNQVRIDSSGMSEFTAFYFG